MATFAFRCKNCGKLHHGDHAGLNDLPHACCNCGKGVDMGFDPKALSERLRKATTDKERLALAEEIGNTVLQKKLCPENWEVLADCDNEVLVKYGLKPDQVHRHSGKAFAARLALEQESIPAGTVVASRQVAVLGKDDVAKIKDKAN